MLIEGLSYIELVLIWNFNVHCIGICEKNILLTVHLSEYFFGLFDAVRVSLRQDSHKLTQRLKASFWGSVRGKFSVLLHIAISYTLKRRCAHAYLRRGLATSGAICAKD